MKQRSSVKIGGKTDNKRMYRIAGILSFALPVMTMLVLFVLKGIYPFGDRSFLSMDLYHQYMPFFSEFVRSVKAGQGISYSWNLGVGSNFLALYVYYLASPLHWLGFLVPEAYIIEFLTYLIVVKTGLCGLTAFWYLNRRNGLQALFFSSFYALSGFMAAYSWNIMWLDCVILLPLIAAGLESLVKEGKCTLYCVTLALSIFTNYYISIMICIFLILYFVFLYCTEKHPGGGAGDLGRRHFLRHARPVALFAFYSLLAAGMACALLIPEVCAVLRTDFGDFNFPQEAKSYFSVLDMLTRHCLAVPVEKGLAHWPNIYCGTAVFLFLPLYAVNERIPARRRFGMLAMAGFLLLGFSTNVLNFIWHGLNYPDSLPARQSFLYIFLVLVMCSDAFRYMDFSKDEEKKRILYVYLGAVAALLFAERFAQQEDVSGIVWMSFGFVTVYACLLYLAHVHRTDRWRVALCGIALASAVIEAGLNTYYTGVSNVSRSEYLADQEDYKRLYDWTKGQEDGFYRMEKFTRKTKNDGALAGYPTASVFSSTMNSAVMDFFDRLGMRHSKVFYAYDGATAFTSALLNVKYLYGKETGYENVLFKSCGQSGEVGLYRAEFSLPFGYVAPDGYDLPDGYDNNGLRLQNQMVRELGIGDVLFQRCAAHSQGDDVSFTAPSDGIYYGIVTASGTKKIRVEGGEPEKQDFSDLKTGGVLYLGYLGAGQSVRISNNDKSDETPKVNVDVYRMDTEVLAEALDILSAQHLEQVAYDSTHLSGVLRLQKPGRLILSVPFEEGWQVEINGEKVRPELFGEVFMAFDLEPGEYTLKMRYVPEGRYAGIAANVVSVLCFLGILFFGNRQLRNDWMK